MSSADKMIEFFTELLGKVAEWLMTEPIIYFTGIFLGCSVIGLIYKLWRLR